MSGVRRNPERHAFLGKEFRENRDKACTKMIEQATNRDLAQGLRTHLEETKKQIERLDQVFKKLNEQPKGTDCPAIDGLIEEANETAGEVDDKAVLDAALIAAKPVLACFVQSP